MVKRCRGPSFSCFHVAGGQPSLSLILFHIERTSSSDLPILAEITRHENRDFSSPFKVRSFCLSSKVQVDNGLEERDLDLSIRRRHFAGTLGTALAFSCWWLALCFCACYFFLIILITHTSNASTPSLQPLHKSEVRLQKVGS